jgi:hypothetical protein
MNEYEKIGLLWMILGTYGRAIDLNNTFNLISNVVFVAGVLIYLIWGIKNE